MSVDDKNVTFKLTSSKYSNLKHEDKKEQDIELDIVNLCGKILAVLKCSYLTDDRFINETDNIALNYVEYD